MPLRDHPLLFAVHCWPMGMNGIRDIAMISGRDTPLHATPNYSRDALTKGILRSTHAMVDHFPKQFHCLPFFRIQDKTASPSLDQHLIGVLKKEFWSGKGAPQVGLLHENLSAFGPNASGGSVLIQEKADTYIMLQAIESWAKPTQGFAGAVKRGSPEVAIQNGHDNFGCRYFEIYMVDLLHKDFEDGFKKWHTFLHRGGSKPTPAQTPIEGKAPAEGNSGRLKSVDVEKNTITVTVGDKDQVFSVAGANLLKPDGEPVPGGLKAAKSFLERQALTVTFKTETKEGKEVVTEVRIQPAGRPDENRQKPPEKPQGRKPDRAPALDGIQIDRDLEYGKTGDISLRLDICQAKELPQDPMPVVIYIHGGGWKSGDKGDILARKDPVSTGLMRNGYCFITINYRLSGVAPFPAAVEDCKCAVRWVRPTPRSTTSIRTTSASGAPRRADIWR